MSNSALHLAAKNNDVSFIESLLPEVDNIDARDDFNRTPLILAAEFNRGHTHSTSIELLLKNGANINAQDNEGRTPLHHLIINRSNLKTVNLLLKFNPDVNVKDNNGRIPLFEAAAHEKNVAIVDLLVKRGSDVNNVSTEDGSTPLHSASKIRSNKKTIKCLFENGANLNAQNYRGVTPLMQLFYPPTKTFAANFKKGSLSILKIILEHFALLQALGTTVDPKIIEFITKWALYEDYFQRCTDELTYAKSAKLGNSWLTCYDILTGSEMKLKNYAGNQELMADFKIRLKHFKIYGALMQKNVAEGTEKREFFDAASIRLSDCLPIFNPNHLVVRDVLDCLSTKELTRLCDREFKKFMYRKKKNLAAR